MEDQQIYDTIDDVRDTQERQQLRTLFKREGRSAAFWEALGATLHRQVTQQREQRRPLGPARWVARKSGNLLGRAVRSLEQQSIRLDEASKKNAQSR
jgi:hypothetical protein